MTRANGQFISEFQLSFENLGNRDYIFQRASDGLVTDAKFFDMLPEVKTVENRGAVHNFRPDKDWAEQAEKFLDLSSGKGFTVLCGDYESGVLDRQAAINFWCFLKRLEEQKPNKRIIFYTTIYKLRDNLNKYNGVETIYGVIDWEYFDFWIAQYPVKENADGTTTLLADPQTASPYLSIGGVTVRKTPPKFWQYWADGNQKGAEFGCGSRDTNLDVAPDMTPEECSAYFSHDEEPLPPVDCCEELADDVQQLKEANIIDGLNHDAMNESIRELRLEAMSGISGNADDIGSLKFTQNKLVMETQEQEDRIDSLQSLVKTCSLGIAELGRRMDNLLQGQLELAENGIGYEEKFTELDKDFDYFIEQHAREIGIVEDKLDTHSHIEPVGGTFWQRLRWLFTGKTSV